MAEQNFEWPGVITISDPVTLINEIASRYETLERVIMEYVDNSIDDADDMAKDNNGKYPYNIKIKVIIDRENRRIIIVDNCRGMDFSTLSRIVHKIGESKKRACPWLNGRFGFGVHAFRAFCKEIVFETKHSNDRYYRLVITDNNLNVKPPEIINDKFSTNTGTGTLVILQNFKEDFFDILTVEAVKEEIETHFELLLRRDDITIQVGYEGEEFQKCKPFNYDQIPGKNFHKKKIIKYKGDEYPIEIFLKVGEVPIHKKVRFFAKGRRILYIKDDKSFINKSKYRTAVWDHPNLTGYIEVGDLVEPVITRDGFKRGKNRTLLYEAILELEDDIKDIIDEINRKYEDHSLGKLEDVLTKALRKLAKEDALRFRTEIVKGNGDVSLAPGGGSTYEDGVGGPTGEGGSGSSFGGPGEGEMEGPSGEGEGTLQGRGTGGPLPQEGTSEYSGTRRRSSGFSIKFSHLPPDAEGRIFRSQFNNGIIVINMDHPDFQERIERTRKGELKITHRLISYLAAVISIHYKDQYYEKYHNQPEVRTELFDQQVEFIFRLESTLIPFLKEIKEMILTSNGEENEE